MLRPGMWSPLTGSPKQAALEGRSVRAASLCFKHNIHPLPQHSCGPTRESLTSNINEVRALRVKGGGAAVITHCSYMLLCSSTWRGGGHFNTERWNNRRTIQQQFSFSFNLCRPQKHKCVHTLRGQEGSRFGSTSTALGGESLADTGGSSQRRAVPSRTFTFFLFEQKPSRVFLLRPLLLQAQPGPILCRPTDPRLNRTVFSFF